MISIEDLRLAVALSRAESLSAAARLLNVSPPALSMRLRKLETRLGLALANRDARRLSLTADGERFSRESALLLEQLEALPESFRQKDLASGGSALRRCWHGLSGSIRSCACTLICAKPPGRTATTAMP
jgi:DNA-binding transcriptional LysR family regulator